MQDSRVPSGMHQNLGLLLLPLSSAGINAFPCSCHLWSRVCLHLTALVPHRQLAKAEEKGETGACSVLGSVLEITASTAE